MRMTITATSTITEVDDREARVWEGVTEQGVACKVFVCRIAVPNAADVSQFEAELKEAMPPPELMLPLRSGLIMG